MPDRTKHELKVPLFVEFMAEFVLTTFFIYFLLIVFVVCVVFHDVVVVAYFLLIYCSVSFS